MQEKRDGCGVVAPLVTIFSRDGSIDYEGTKSHLNFLIENGVHSIFALGTTQENAALDEQEYKDLVKAIIDETAGRVPVFIGVSSPAVRLSQNYAGYAEAAGADAVFAGGPYYMRVTEDELIQFHKDIAASVKIPYLLYNNPGLSKLGLSVMQIAKLTCEGVVSMVKDTSGNPVRTQDLKMLCKPGTKVFFGDDYGAYQAMVVGADGWTAGIANIIPKECVEIWNKVAVEKNYEEGFALWKKILPLLNMTISKDMYGQAGSRSDWLQIYKEGAKIRNGTNSFMRRPLFELPDIDRGILAEVMKDLGYY